MILGTLILSFSKPENPDLIWPGCIAFGIGAVGFKQNFLSYIPAFPESRGVLASLLMCAGSLAQIVLIGYQLIPVGKFNYFWFGMTGFGVFQLIITPFITPKYKMTEKQLVGMKTWKDRIPFRSKDRAGQKTWTWMDLTRSMLLPINFCYYLAFLITVLRYLMILSQMIPWLRWVFESNPKQEELVDKFVFVYSYSRIGAIVTNFLAGFLQDAVINFYKKKFDISRKYASGLMVITFLLFTNLVLLLVSYLMTIRNNEAVVYSIMLIISIFFVFPYTGRAIFASNFAEKSVYMTVIGILSTAEGVLVFGLSGITKWVEYQKDGNYAAAQYLYMPILGFNIILIFVEMFLIRRDIKQENTK